MKTRFFVCITLLTLFHRQLWPQALTMQVPRQQNGAAGSAPGGDSPGAAQEAASPNASTSAPSDALPDDPSELSIPVAEPVPTADQGVPVGIHALEQRQQGDIFTLTGEVVLTYRSYTLRADKLTYDRSTSEVDASGHLQVEGGPDDELITASHGTMNLDQETARFFDVLGSIGVRQNPSSRRIVYTTLNPFIFTGRIVIKTGPNAYKITDGTMTSCRLPKPDWRLFASDITVDNGQARAANSTFRLLQVPVFYLPYVTHPVDVDGRQSGFLIPTFGTSSSKGTILGESIYWAINRSADLVAGAEYYSKRGWAPNAEFRFKGAGLDFATLRFTALLDRGLQPENIDQGGQDLLFNGRHDFSATTRSVANVEYLSSYVYRQAFNENFQLAVSSEVKSDAFLVHSNHGLIEDVRFDRYQSFETTIPSPTEIRILHLPSVDFEAVDQPLGPRFGQAQRSAQFYWGFTGSAAGLSRSEPGFTTSHEVGRFDLYPHLSLPIHLGGWTFRPEGAVRNTFYTKSQVSGSGSQVSTAGLPTESNSTLNRSSYEADFEMRPPAIERVFNSGWLSDTLHHEVKHTIEPEVEYRYVTGINNFNQVLRFDTTDIASNTNQVTYSLTQRLFLKNLSTHPCRQGELLVPRPDTNPTAGINAGTTPDTPASEDSADQAQGQTEARAGSNSADKTNEKQPERLCGGGTREWINWQVGQRYYFDPSFGGAFTSGTRNVLESTLDLTGVAFVLRQHDASPVLSRLRVRTSGNTDVEWDLDYNTRAGRIQSSNLFANYHEGNFFTGIGQSRMVAFEQNPSTPVASLIPVTYDQLRLLVGFGSPAHRGLSLAANTGYDFTQDFLQYGGLQTSYNWDCCGLSVEYRRFALGSVRNENQYRFNFTLAGIGTAGNLRRAERLY